MRNHTLLTLQVLLHVLAVQQSLAETSLCKLLNFFPFTDRGVPARGPWAQELNTTSFLTPMNVEKAGYDFMATTLLAMQHFNNRDFSVVAPLPQWMQEHNLMSTCTHQFDINQTVFVDTGRDETYAFEAMLPYAPRQMGQRSDYCAMQGPYLEKSIGVTDKLAATFQIPQLHYHLTEYRTSLTRFAQHNIMNWASHEVLARDIVSWLQERNAQGLASPRDYLAVVHFNKEWMARLATQIQSAGTLSKDRPVQVKLFEAGMAPPPFDKQTFYYETMLKVKNTGYTTIILCYDRHEHLLDHAASLEQAGMLNGEYLFLLIQDSAPVHEINYVYHSTSPNTALGKLLHGAIVLSPLDGFRWNPDQDKFLKAWQSEGTMLREMANPKSPGYVKNPPDDEGDSNSTKPPPPPPPASNSTKPPPPRSKKYTYFQADENYFVFSTPYAGSSFVYDSVMAIGFGACLQEARERLDIPPPPKGSTPPPKDANGTIKEPDPNLAFGLPPYRYPSNRYRNLLTPFLGAITDIDIPHGASGTIEFSTDRKYRARESLKMGAFNIRYNPTSSEWEAVLTSIRETDLTWNETAANVYNAGALQPPSITLKIQEENYLTTWVRVLGLFLLCVAWLVGLFCMVSVYVLRERSPLIRAAQPFFLILVCAGSMTTSAAIFTLSFDEGVGWSNDALSMACTLSPWLFFLGQVTVYSALFCKMWRVDRLLQMRHRRITVAGAMAPFVALLFVCVGLLLAWTISDPWVWDRTTLPGVEPPETYGKCQSDNVEVFFVPLVAVIVFATVLAVISAYRTLDVTSALSDTKPTFYAVGTHLQGWAIGLPVLSALNEDSADATYLARVLVCWIFGISTPCFLIVPRLYKHFQTTMGNSPEANAPESRVRITGLGLHPSHKQDSSSSVLPKRPTSAKMAIKSQGDESGERAPESHPQENGNEV